MSNIVKFKPRQIRLELPFAAELPLSHLRLLAAWLGCRLVWNAARRQIVVRRELQDTYEGD